MTGPSPPARPLADARASTPGAVANPAACTPRAPRPSDAATDAAVARLWRALRDVEDPEIPVSVVDMGLIVALEYEGNTVRLQLTYTAMGCPAMEMIQDDIRARLLREPGVDRVEIEVVWDPAWTRQRLSDQARATMRELGIGV